MSINVNALPMPIFCFNTDYADCAPGRCKQFGVNPGCHLRKNWSDEQLIKDFGIEAMEEYYKTDESKQWRLNLLLNK